MNDIHALSGLLRRDSFVHIDRDSHQLFTREKKKLQDLWQSQKSRQVLLQGELRARDDHAGSSLPIVFDKWLYYDCWNAGDDYVRHCRRSIAGGVEQLLFDENAIGRGRAYFDIGDWGLDLTHSRLTWSVDTSGDEAYRLFVKDICSGDVLDISPEFCDANFEWGQDNDIYYGRLDDDGRVSSVHRHVVGQDWNYDEQILYEADEAFSVGVSKSRCNRWLMVESGGFDSSETRLIDLLGDSGSTRDLRLLKQRVEGLEYYVDVCAERIIIIANTELEFELFLTTTASPSYSDWIRIDRPASGWIIESADAFSDFYVLSERQGAQIQLRAFDYSHVPVASISPDRPFESISLAENPRPESHKLRIDKIDAVHPERTLCWDIDAASATELWEEDVGEDYNVDDFACRRLFVRSHDGAIISISLVWNKDRVQAGGNPCLLNVYGAYQDVCDLDFDADRLGLLKRGIFLVSAHVRGGGEGGREWYEQGRRDKKINGLIDFVVAARALYDMAIARPRSIVVQAESAGALIAAAALNEEPELFAGAILDVPFVDMAGSLSDEKLPTTIADREEFGNPNIDADMRYIARLSPFDNISSQTLAPVLLSGGVSDERVPVREPLKWALRVRERSNSTVYVAIDTDAGHHGPMGRRREIEELARNQAFILSCLERQTNFHLFKSESDHARQGYQFPV